LLIQPLNPDETIYQFKPFTVHVIKLAVIDFTLAMGFLPDVMIIQLRRE